MPVLEEVASLILVPHRLCSGGITWTPPIFHVSSKAGLPYRSLSCLSFSSGVISTPYLYDWDVCRDSYHACLLHRDQQGTSHPAYVAMGVARRPFIQFGLSCQLAGPCMLLKYK